jgi:hypothetical protein
MPVIAKAIYDTLVFLVISHYIVSFRIQPSEIAGALVRSRSSLQTDFPGYRADHNSTCDSHSDFLLTTSWRIFFSATIGLSISFTVILLVPGSPAISRVMLSVLTLAPANAMGCRVYWAVKLGLIQDPPSTHSFKTLQFNPTPTQSGHEPWFERPTFAESLVDMTNLGINADHPSRKPTLTLQEDLEAYDCT